MTIKLVPPVEGLEYVHAELGDYGFLMRQAKVFLESHWSAHPTRWDEPYIEAMLAELKLHKETEYYDKIVAIYAALRLGVDQ